MLNYLLLSVGGLMLIGHVVLAWFIWRFSRESRVTHRKADSKTEWKWSLVPLVLMTFVAEGGVLAIGVPVWKKFYAAPPPADSIVVEITAEQFAWTSRYPGPDAKFGRTNVKLIDDENTLGLDSKDATSKDDLIVGGELRLPVNKPAHLRLRSKDVLHSLFLPSQRVKQDVVPGMVIDAWFVPTQTGEFEILCTELCGLGHYKMRGVLRVTTQEEYEKWLAERASM
jgi:cytochrome c oxidase subunit 2